MSEIISSQPVTLPAPGVPMSVRVGMRDDIAFMDALQKKHGKALGFFPRAQMEGYIDGGNVLIAVDSATGERLGYVASKDRYLKRDELGAIFQMCVAPGHERKFIAANLLREVFERSSYGCRLYCCWCAQDLPANKFWEAMGFVPIAYRAGSATKGKNGSPRVHIYWQKRIRAGDDSTPYWFPAKTEGGAIREDRIILPIPPGMTWRDALPVLLANEQTGAIRDQSSSVGKRLHAEKRQRTKADSAKPGAPKLATTSKGRLFFAPPLPEPARKTKTKPRRTALPREAHKANPALVQKARELRDRWQEHVAENGIEQAPSKYDVARLPRRVERVDRPALAA